jgi:hypothetical protein
MGQEAVTADISMAYNGTRLHPEHMKYQRYLWRDDLLPQNPVKVMYVCTLIYGVKPSSQQTQVTLEKLACHFKEKGECLDGAAVLEKDTYVDDITTSTDSMQESVAIAQDIETILARESMGVKAFTFSKIEPDEKVSAHVGLAGYRWSPVDDLVKLDIGPPVSARQGGARGRPPSRGTMLKHCAPASPAAL